MREEKIEIKNELLYLFLVLIVTEIFNDSILNAKFSTTVIIGILGIVLLLIWFIRTFQKR